MQYSIVLAFAALAAATPQRYGGYGGFRGGYGGPGPFRGGYGYNPGAGLAYGLGNIAGDLIEGTAIGLTDAFNPYGGYYRAENEAAAPAAPATQ